METLEKTLTCIKQEEKEFVSSAHNNEQHRVFGFITTNIRSVDTFATYIEELLPKYIELKNDYTAWEKWFKNPSVLKKNKQKFKRLELAKILFRKIKDTPDINKIGEKLYRIDQNYGKNYLQFILNLYLLTGRYFDVDNQPLVEINKILSSKNETFIKDSTQDLLQKNLGRTVLALIFYNPAVQTSYDFAYKLIHNDVSKNELSYLASLTKNESSMLYKRIDIAGGLNNFYKELGIIINYYLFKQSCIENSETLDFENIIKIYVSLIYDYHLNDYFNLEEKQKTLEVLLDSSNRIILKDVFEFTLGIKFDNNFVRKKERKNIKQIAIEKYGYKCFFDCFAQDEDIHKAHELNYFNTKKDLPYLEGHHMIQLENAKFFEHDIDIPENIIPLCPNCHRKIHNAKSSIVYQMLSFYVEHSNKKELLRKGIFADIETLASFYGIEND